MFLKRFLAIAILTVGISLSAQAQGKLKSQTTAHSATLSWTASVTSGVTYNVYRSTSVSGPFTVVSTPTVPGSAVSFTDSAVTPGASYIYQVTSVCGATCPAGIAGESVPSNQITVIIPNPQPPAAPTNLHLGSVTVVVVSP